MYVSGSVALSKYISLNRTSKDVDYICSEEEFEDFIAEHKVDVVCQRTTRRGYSVHILKMLPLEFEIATPVSTTEDLIDLVEKHGLYLEENGLKYLHPSVVYTLKMSHRFLKNSKHFQKTMGDIRLLRSLGFDTPSCLKEWLIEREKETLDYEHPKLNQSKLSFFNDTVDYKYDHDSLHLAVKYFDQPAYEFIKGTGSEVLTSKKKFKEASDEIKLRCGYEEALVLALERHLIPGNFIHDPKKSFLLALEKLCTGISSGDFRTYVWENYDTIVSLYDGKYVDQFNYALNHGIVKLYQKPHS